MKINSFERDIDSRIIDRGKNYFQESAVDDLEVVTGNKWQAAVNGSEIYEVEIGLSQGNIVG